jgi:hypothetical protein
MDKEEKKILAPDEVDLVRVFVLTVRYFNKNKFVFLAFNLLALGLGSGYYFFKSKVYESKFIAECQSIPDSRVVDLIQDLDKIRENEDWSLLAQKLKMKVDEVKKIKEFEPLPNVVIEKEAKGLDDYLLPTTEISYKFGLIVKVKDNLILPKLQNGIIHYLSSNEYSTIRVDRFLENRKSLLKYLEKQIINLDSLNLLFATKIVSSSNISSTLTSPGDYKGLLVNLKERALAVEDQIKFCGPVMVIQPFTAFKYPVAPEGLIVFGLSLLFGNLVSFLAILIISLRKTYIENKDIE